jgi:hypothetical protein
MKFEPACLDDARFVDNAADIKGRRRQSFAAAGIVQNLP